MNNEICLNLFLSQVSWIRRRDWHILTVGRKEYTSDQRYDYTDIQLYISSYASCLSRNKIIISTSARALPTDALTFR